jgi:hypothetical protein
MSEMAAGGHSLVLPERSASQHAKRDCQLVDLAVASEVQ